MRVRLDTIGDDPFEWSERWTPTRAEVDHPDLLTHGEVEAAGRLTRLQLGYHLRISLHYPETLRCVRCLGPAESTRRGTIELLVLIGPEEEAEEERELSDDDLGVLRLAEPLLDTHPLLSEHLQLNIPMRPLCREDCAGLCVRCGADLNVGPCGCPSLTDPRWEALAALRDRAAGDGPAGH